ncbi:glycerol-3-phosphate acyltransferase [Rahnella perminowiae]|uniref:glycerol-3-phosphate acyltransferase n=1 Tax=Rahnella perminowiae TaxID=2816244 RepID=UPI0030B8A6E8
MSSKACCRSWLAYRLNIPPMYLGLTAIAACLGHICSILCVLKAARGVATAFGAIAPIGWGPAGLMTGTWLADRAAEAVIPHWARSNGALIAQPPSGSSKPGLPLRLRSFHVTILLRHHDSIQRLWRGQEGKIWDELKKET